VVTWWTAGRPPSTTSPPLHHARSAHHHVITTSSPKSRSIVCTSAQVCVRRARWEGLDAGRAQASELGPPCGDELVFWERCLARRAHLIDLMVYSMAPDGTFTEAVSPTCLPISALPTGLSLEIRPSVGRASGEPTMV